VLGVSRRCLAGRCGRRTRFARSCAAAPAPAEAGIAETLGAPDALLVIDETGFVKPGKTVLRGCPSVHRLVGLQPPGLTRLGQDHQPPDRRVRGLCLRARPCLHRPPALSSKALSGRSRAPGGRACAGQVAFATKPAIVAHMIRGAIAADMPFSWVAVFLGGRRQHLRRGRDRDAAQASGQRLTCSASPAVITSGRGARSWRSPVRPPGSRGRLPQRIGSACWRAPAPRASEYTADIRLGVS
jgi:hypothetical protein